MLVRTEAPADILPIDHLLRLSLKREKEADMVNAARECGQITLSLVACRDDGEIVGYALFTPFQQEGEYQYWQHLVLVAVQAEFSKTELTLIQDGLNMLLELGYPVCTATGDPEYYRELGFVSASQLSLNSDGVGNAENFQVFELVSGAAHECHTPLKPATDDFLLNHSRI